MVLTSAGTAVDKGVLPSRLLKLKMLLLVLMPKKLATFAHCLLCSVFD